MAPRQRDIGERSSVTARTHGFSFKRPGPTGRSSWEDFRSARQTRSSSGSRLGTHSTRSRSSRHRAASKGGTRTWPIRLGSTLPRTRRSCSGTISTSTWSDCLMDRSLSAMTMSSSPPGWLDADPDLHARILGARSELIRRFEHRLPPFADVSPMTPSQFRGQQNQLASESMHPKPVQFSYTPIDMPPQPVVTCAWVAGRMTAADRLTLRLRVGLSGLRWAQGRA